MLVKGKIVLIPFPFTDLTTSKLRPTLILLERRKDVVGVFISSRVPEEPSQTEVVVEEDHPEFRQTGLKKSSVIRLDKVATISKDLLVGEIGEVGPSLKKTINERLRELYSL
ncbi:hypothetical protein AKJ50_00540 [candidate division MSBL1 archaeon SCGC-AAA382A13]|uniref:MazF family transcriptional regulator n=1 Tax=candidate division MSBL1 archaeon SCGC-AAA382A13 TaxID=1698279 RepID=A0A133VGI8_9EURY|nr:hypothetical protein AKJ50_00540 [candidate division MSBL1 archaeon SCGC-AAA382A13]